MPKRFAKRRSSGGKRKVVRGRRRLTPAGLFTPPSKKRGGMTSRPTASPYGAPTKRPRQQAAGGYYYNPPTRYRASALKAPTGKNVVAAIRRGKSKKTNKGAIRKKIMDALIFGANPILKSDIKYIPNQMDWASGTQGVNLYVMANTPAEIEQKFAKMKDALYYNSAIAIPATATDVTSQRMVVFPSVTIFNLKNTCTHTCYLEARVYKVKGYHGTSSLAAWQEALLNDNLIQNPLAAPYPTEETINSLGKRPDFRSPYLNCRYTEMKSARAKWVLEPGQETQFIYKMPGFTFDQARYNVEVMSAQPTRCPQTYEVIFFQRAETVTGTVDADVCPGSGHIAVNTQLIESWQALPMVKKYQNIASNSWGAIPEADEYDLNDGDIVQEAYQEGV